MKSLLPFLAFVAILAASSCSPEKKEGCTDPTAVNYNPDAEVDNGTCAYEQDTATVITVSGNITESTTWKADKKYFLLGFVYVKSGAVLTIEPGTIIKGDKESKGTVIIERGAQINAVGTASNPIVFTSNFPVGQRTYGDWGGIIICGKSPVNVPGGEGVVEGGTEAFFGGDNADDNSGIIRYLRIEFAGIAFQPNQEINGLTMAGVGRGTTIDHIQVSYCGDDSFEWFGGTVNCKYLVVHRGWDDNYDTDNGFTGSVQFAVGFNDPNVADASGSNGFESDNDPGGSDIQPYTSCVFTNISIFGPKVTAQTSVDFQYESAAHLRSNTRKRIFNSVLSGYPEGVYIKGNFTQNNALDGSLMIKNTIVAGCDQPLKVDLFSTFNISQWFNDPEKENQIYETNAELMVGNAWSLTAPDPMPQSGSPLLSGASFSDPMLNNPLHDITPVSYRGAFGTENWMQGWTNFDPQNTVY